MIKVLVIDDDILTRKVLASMVERMGHCAIQSGNGKHAWETLWENPDMALVITDLMMPDMDGSELVQIIRGNQAFHELPIILVSGVVEMEQVEAIMKLGGCFFCRKPVASDEFKSLVKRALSGEANGQKEVSDQAGQ